MPLFLTFTDKLGSWQLSTEFCAVVLSCITAACVAHVAQQYAVVVECLCNAYQAATL